jgi:hypothetical protein
MCRISCIILPSALKLFVITKLKFRMHLQFFFCQFFVQNFSKGCPSIISSAKSGYGVEWRRNVDTICLRYEIVV